MVTYDEVALQPKHSQAGWGKLWLRKERKREGIFMVNVKRIDGIRKLEYHKDDDIWLMETAEKWGVETGKVFVAYLIWLGSSVYLNGLFFKNYF
jgi:hypothetical protein